MKEEKTEDRTSAPVHIDCSNKIEQNALLHKYAQTSLCSAKSRSRTSLLVHVTAVMSPAHEDTIDFIKIRFQTCVPAEPDY